MGVKYVPFVPVVVPTFDRHNDEVTARTVMCTVEFIGGDSNFVRLVPEDASPTVPWLATFSLTDVMEAVGWKRD